MKKVEGANADQRIHLLHAWRIENNAVIEKSKLELKYTQREARCVGMHIETKDVLVLDCFAFFDLLQPMQMYVLFVLAWLQVIAKKMCKMLGSWKLYSSMQISIILSLTFINHM